MTMRRGWWHQGAIELVNEGWTNAQIAEKFGVSRQGVHWLLVNRGLQSESMRRRRVATGDPMKVKVLKFEQDLIDRVELVRVEMERRRPGDRTAWAKAMRTLLDEALRARGR